MSKKPDEINDDEIRVISSATKEPKIPRRWLKICLLLFPILLLGIILVVKFYHGSEEQTGRIATGTEESVLPETPPVSISDEQPTVPKRASVSVTDTVVGGHGLRIFAPENARPSLVVGHESLNDSTILLATQAADVRGDNGKIAGAFVLNGELLSKGEAKAGYCSIINGELTIGIADATPALEQALTDDGYFFRQYPLVVGGQIVENKPKGKAIRKALAEIDGRIYVVMSQEKLTFREFSQLLIDTGVRNAIYLVGSGSYGFYLDSEGNRVRTGGPDPYRITENLNYIIWRK